MLPKRLIIGQRAPWAAAVVVQQLVEGSLQRPEIHGSNPAIVKMYLLSTVLKTTYVEKTKAKKKRPKMTNSFFGKKRGSIV